MTDGDCLDPSDPAAGEPGALHRHDDHRDARFTIDNAASFPGPAVTDKPEPVTVDEIAYLNSSILGLEDIDISSFT